MRTQADPTDTIAEVRPLRRPVALHCALRDSDGYRVRVLALSPGAHIDEAGWIIPSGRRWVALTADGQRLGLHGSTYLTGPNASCETVRTAAQVLARAVTAPTVLSVEVEEVVLLSAEHALSMPDPHPPTTITRIVPTRR